MSQFIKRGTDPVGTVRQFMRTSVPRGYIPFGATYAKADYPRLYSHLAGQVAETATHFTLPPADFLRQADRRVALNQYQDWTTGAGLVESTAYPLTVDAESGAVRVMVGPPDTGLTSRVHYFLQARTGRNTGKWAFAIRYRQGDPVVPCELNIGVIPITAAGEPSSVVPDSCGVLFMGDSGEPVTSSSQYMVLLSGPAEMSMLSGQYVNRGGDDGDDMVILFDLDAGTRGYVSNGYVNANAGALAALDDLTVPGEYIVAARIDVSAGFATGADMGFNIVLGDLQSQIPMMPEGYANWFEGDALPTEYAILQTGGAATHTHIINGTALSVAQLPAHDHGIILGYNEGAPPLGDSAVDIREYEGTPTLMDETRNMTTETGGGETHTHTAQAGSNLPPYLTTVYCIKY